MPQLAPDDVGSRCCRRFGCALRLHSHHGAEAFDSGFEGEGANHRQISIFFDCLDRLLGFDHRRHGFHADGVGAAFGQGNRPAP